MSWTWVQSIMAGPPVYQTHLFKVYFSIWIISIFGLQKLHSGRAWIDDTIQMKHVSFLLDDLNFWVAKTE